MSHITQQTYQQLTSIERIQLIIRNISHGVRQQRGAEVKACSLTNTSLCSWLLTMNILVLYSWAWSLGDELCQTCGDFTFGEGPEATVFRKYVYVGHVNGHVHNANM